MTAHYHVAPTEARESISEHGLDPSKAADQFDRSGDPDDPNRKDANDEDKARAPGVWVYSSLEDAEDWADYMGEQDIYEVDEPTSMVSDPFASTENGYYTANPIPADRLRRLDKAGR